MAGQRGRQMRKPASSAMLATERPSAAGEKVERFDQRKGDLLQERSRFGAAERQAQQRLDLA
jgi:hypothetical protein